MTGRLRVIIHAGFHKTGTSALQGFLKLNRTTLNNDVRVYLGREYGNLDMRARKFGFDPSARQLHMFSKSANEFAQGLPDEGTLLLTRVAFAGTIVGSVRRDGTLKNSYEDTAIPLATRLYDALRARFAERAEIEFLYALRAHGAFLKSCYAHQLSTRRTTEDYQTFFAQMDFDRTLHKEFEALKAALPRAQFHNQWLEDTSASRFGTAQTLLSILNLPKPVCDQLRPVSAQDYSQNEALTDKLLWMNRNVADDDELQNQKARLLALAEG